MQTSVAVPQIMATQNYLCCFMKFLYFVCLFEVCKTNLKVGHQWHRWGGCHRRADDVFQIVCHPSGAHHCGYIGTGKSDFKSDTYIFWACWRLEWPRESASISAHIAFMVNGLIESLIVLVIWDITKWTILHLLFVLFFVFHFSTLCEAMLSEWRLLL